MMTSKLTYERLKQVLYYDPDTGIFQWIIATGRRRKAGDRAGSIDEINGYEFIRIDGVTYRAQRLAWFYMTGEWPVGEVDHHNTLRADNRFTNFRDCSRSQNAANMKRQSNSASGLKGVSWHKLAQKWVASISPKGRSIHLGLFNCRAAAHFAYAVAADEHFGEFARAA